VVHDPDHLLAKVGREGRVELGEALAVGRHPLREVLEVEPLQPEVLGEAAAPWVAEHPADLRAEHSLVLQPAGVGQADEFVIG
jgi:hypothetical protein